MCSLSSLLTKKQDIDMSKSIDKQQDTEKHLQGKLPIGDVGQCFTYPKGCLTDSEWQELVALEYVLTDECMSSGTYTETLNYATNFNVPLLIHIVRHSNLNKLI